MNGARTTVVMPLYNGAAWIEKTLRSVAEQDAPPAEVLVIDDGSTDRSPEIVRSFPGVRLLGSPKKGANAARAFGLSVAASPYVAFLDQDDVWHPAHLGLLQSALESDPLCRAAAGGAALFFDDKELRFGVPRGESDEFDPWAMFPCVALSTPSQVLIRREALLACGGWETRFAGIADHHAWLRLSAQTPLRVLRSATIGYRQHRTSYSTVLRSADAFGYIRRFLAASADAIPLRAASHPEDAVLAEARIRLAETMTDWLFALRFGTWSDRRAAASALERELGRHSPEAAGLVWRQLFYFVSRSARSSFLRRGFLVARTLARAPFACPRLRASLGRLIAARLFRAVGRGQPSESRIPPRDRSRTPSVAAR